MQNYLRKNLVILTLMILFNSASVIAKSPAALSGAWHAQLQGTEIDLVLNEDGSGTLNQGPIEWAVQGKTLIIMNQGTPIIYSFSQKGDTMNVSGGDLAEPLTLSRQKAGTGGLGSVSKNNNNAGGKSEPANKRANLNHSLVGKWCYMSNVYASNGGRASNRCFTLNENGTYEYYGETSNSNAYGSSASQESDAGTWSATENSIIANSNTMGTRTFSLERRNHPKNRDPMLILDGDAYVTFFQKAPW